MKGYLLIILSGILYGTIPIFANLLKNVDVSTMEQVVIRLSISVVLLFLVLKFVMKSSLKIEKKDYLHLVLFSLIGIGLLFSFYLSAAVISGVTIAVLLLYTQPVITMVLSRVILKEQFSYYSIIAMVLSLAGVCLIMQVWNINWSNFSVGYIFGIASGICYSIYIIYVRHLVAYRKIESNALTFWSFLIGVIWLIPLWIIFHLIFKLPEISAINYSLSSRAWLYLVGFSLLPSLLAYLFFNKGLTYVKSHKAGILVLLEPVSAILMGALILNEAVSSYDIVGGTLILSSLVIIRLSKSEKAKV